MSKEVGMDYDAGGAPYMWLGNIMTSLSSHLLFGVNS